MTMCDLGLFFACIFALLATPGVAQDAVPSVDTFLRRGGSAASIIGDYIYFDGGEVSQEGYYRSSRWSNAVNSTLSIDISSSWTPENVDIQELSKPSAMVPKVKQSILTDESARLFYIWGGHISWDDEPDDPVLWRFEPDEEGGGNWTAENSGSALSRVIQDTERMDSAAYVSTSNAAIIIGGRSTEDTSLEPTGNVEGYVIFNFTTQEWTRESTGSFSSDATVFGASAVFAPIFGPNGLIIVLGGLGRSGEEDEEYLSFRILHFLDPVTRDWHSQTTTGEAPSGRIYHCAVGVTSTNGTFEIFVFGGSNWSEEVDFSDLYVLSLPGFRWTRINGLDSEPRTEHVCTVVGNRQFLSWGGLNADGGENGFAGRDPFPQGIGIFDMTALEWRDNYNASAEEYDSHPSIREWYDEGGLDSMDWSSEEVRQFFVSGDQSGGNISGPNNRTDSGGNGSDDGGPPTDGQGDSRSDTTPAGPIAGGVVGGVVFLAAILVGFWFFRKRRTSAPSTELPGEPKQAPSAYPEPVPASKSHELSTELNSHELSTEPNSHELSTESNTHELSGSKPPGPYGLAHVPEIEGHRLPGPP